MIKDLRKRYLVFSRDDTKIVAAILEAVQEVIFVKVPILDVRTSSKQILKALFIKL